MVVRVLVLSCLIDLAMWLVGSDATNAWQIFAAKLRTHITATGTVPTWSPLCKVLYILTTAIRHSFFRERATGFPNKGEEGPSDNTSCFTQSDDHVIRVSAPLQRLAWLAEFQVPDSCLYQWNLDSGFQSLVAFRIPMPRLPDFTDKNFPDSGNPDSLIIKVGRKAVIMDTSQTLRCRC